MATVAALASGVGSNLIHRMGDVAMKERRRLVLAPRESPLSPIHLANLLRLAEVGAIIAPPMPAFYERPDSLDEVIEATVDRLMLWTGVRTTLPPDRQWRSGQ